VVRPPVEALFLGAPVELRAPVVAQVLQVEEVGAVVPARARDLIGPARARQALAQVVELRLGNLDAERRDVVRHVLDATAAAPRAARAKAARAADTAAPRAANRAEVPAAVGSRTSRAAPTARRA